MPNTTETSNYDLIIIGSGMGSLATASLMASIGKKRVLVLESSAKIGGFLHTFKRGEFHWDPGCHYVSGMEEGNLNRRCMDMITGGRTQWHKMGEYFEKFIFPDLTFDVSSSVKEFEKDLIEKYPLEKAGIKRYFKDIKSLKNWADRWYTSKQYPDWLANIISVGKKSAQRNTLDYLNSITSNKELQAILAAQWPDYGTPPHSSALGIHAIITSAFFNGGYYPIGGPDSIISAAVQQIEDNGGKCLRRHPVHEVLIENNRAYGVRVERKGKSIEFYAPKIVSGAGVFNTFENMIPHQYAKKEREVVRKSQPGISAIVLYLGLKDDPREHGFNDCNYWIYNQLSHNYDDVTLGEVGGAFLSFGSLRDPHQNSHTAQIVTFSQAAEWSEFSDREWKRRGDDYERRKDEFADSLLNFVEEMVPGLKQIVQYSELSTPLTVTSFLNHPGGQIYGRDCTPERISNSFSIGTSVKNLYLTGSDLVNPGIDAAMMIGVMSAGKLLGWTGMPRILARAYTAG